MSKAYAYSILNGLIDEDKELRNKLENIDKEQLSNIDSNEVSED